MRLELVLKRQLMLPVGHPGPEAGSTGIGVVILDCAAACQQREDNRALRHT
jgi:hypothetical protein